jgi:CheY-like chemotaxis protein
MKPGGKASPDSNAWRIYQVMSYRYIEQSSQKEVANDLALSIRQLRRLESMAIRALAELLIAQYPAEKDQQEGPVSEEITSFTSISPGNNAVDNPTTVDTHTGQEQELAWLRKSSPSQTVEVLGLVETAITTIEPLLLVLKVQVVTRIQEDLPPIIGKLTTIRQALLNVLTVSARLVPGGEVFVTVSAESGRILIDVLSHNAKPIAIGNDSEEVLSLAQQLVEISSGTLTIIAPTTGQVLSIRMSLPMTEQIPVLVIDDNEDALRLVRRYLSGSRYQFIGVTDPEITLSMAEEHRPKIILLDVMLPGIDGWELLGRLRSHPWLSDVPIIISTILPQEQLALALGAAEFIRKPVSRESLMAALDRQMSVMEIISH